MTSRSLGLALAMAMTFAATAYGQQPAPPPTAPGNMLDGEQLFATSCGFCHQNGGRAAGRGPKLSGTERTDEELLRRIRVGKEGAMPGYGRAFSDAQLRALLAYIRSLKDNGR
jgi:mono/diheme cytochrome c family protein